MEEKPSAETVFAGSEESQPTSAQINEFLTCGSRADIFCTGKGRQKQIVKIVPFQSEPVYEAPTGSVQMADLDEVYQEAVKTRILSQRVGFTSVIR
ncbi:hypothetical protein HK102_001671 [Quaeritorhiza haematococci]|nr:hypothetical protein HK102_001671 [Quaeritorhiza haematococci]